MKKYMLIILISLEIYFPSISNSYTQDGNPSPDDLREVAEGKKNLTDFVFVGTVSKRSCINDALKFTFKAEKIWKGPKTEQPILSYGSGPGGCDIKPRIACSVVNMEIGKRYLVYANKGNGEFLATSFCGSRMEVLPLYEDWEEHQTYLKMLGINKPENSQEDSGVNEEIEALGKPTYEF